MDVSPVRVCQQTKGYRILAGVTKDECVYKCYKGLKKYYVKIIFLNSPVRVCQQTKGYRLLTEVTNGKCVY